MARMPLSVVAAATAFGLSAHAGEQVALAVIDVARTADGIEIVGRAVGLADGPVSGLMTISRTGQSGSVSTSQGGEIDMKAGQAADIARVGVSFQPGDRLEVVLALSQGANVIARTTLTAGEP